MNDDLEKTIKSAKSWRDSLIAVDVTVHTDGNTIWVNSAERCEVRICGLRDLKGTQAVKAVMAGCGDLVDVMITGDVEICNECGRSVVFGSGLYVNRIPDFNTPEERKEMGKPHPEGDFMCIECEEKFEQEDCGV